MYILYSVYYTYFNVLESKHKIVTPEGLEIKIEEFRREIINDYLHGGESPKVKAIPIMKCINVTFTPSLDIGAFEE